jgi:membrane protease subunit (stomatin/prohibitin family)
MRINDLPDWQKNDILNGIRNGTISVSGAMGPSTYPGVTDKFTLTASGSTTVTNISQMNVGGALRGIDLSANGSAMAQAASASVSKYCADNGVKSNSFNLHDGEATMGMFNDAGITVPGSRSTQKFSTTYMGALEEEKHTIVLKLLGETPDNKPVLKPVTVKHKPKCTTCGKQNRAHAKFCTECGTALEIFA